VYVGREPFIYIADTGNDRIFMLDTFETQAKETAFIRY